jgi:hypothetical protein
MPTRSVSGYQDLFFRLRNNPAAIAATAGGIGLICGALVVAMTSGPSATPSQVAQKPPVQVAPKPPVETTGSATPLKVERVEPPAPVKTDTAAVADCDRQTWPYITQQCLTEREAAQRKVRVITTDKIAPPVVSAIEQETKEPPRITNAPVRKHEPALETATVTPATKPAASTPAPAPVATVTPPPASQAKAAPVIATPVAPPVVAPAPAPMAAPAPAPKPQIAATAEQPPQTLTAQPPPKVAANDKRKSARDARDKRIRDAKARRAPVRDSDDDDAADYSPRSRVVERWTEREYMVPSEESSQRRRVIVIRRGSDNPFGSLFGSAFR